MRVAFSFTNHKKPPDSGGFFFLPAAFIKGQVVCSFLLLLRFFDIMIGIVILGSFSEQRLSFRGGAKSPVLTGEAFAKWVLCFEARRPISRQSGSIWYSLVPLVGACGRRKARRRGSSPNPARAE